MNFVALVWMFVLLVLNGFFVAAEFAFTAARREVVADQPGSGARAATGIMQHLSDTLAGAQVGITLSTLLLGFVAEPAVAGIIQGMLGWIPMSEQVLHTIALVVSVLIVVYLHMVIGEMAPKNIAIATPERLAILLGVPFRWYMTLFRPLIVSLNWLANGILRIFGVEPRDSLETTHTAEDLATVIAAGRQEGVIEEFASKLLSGAILFSERDASEVMVPRPDIVALPASASAREFEAAIVSDGFSRIPVYDGSVDNLVGFIHAKDLLDVAEDDYDQPLPPEVIRPLLAIPETASIRPLLAEMQRTGRHLALIVDEHGGTAGLLSLEDIAEELVGEIRDEYDQGETQGRRLGESEWFRVPGSIRPDALRHLAGLRLPDGDYETLAGFLMERLGRIPRRGDAVTEDAWVMRVQGMDGRRVTEIDVYRRQSG